MDSVALYECHNRACSLGTRGEPGRFSGGATQDTVMLLTGDPEREYGEGICPNCATPGKSLNEEFTPVEGEDPHQHLHDKIADVTMPLQLDAMNPRVEYTLEEFRADTADDQIKLEALVEKETGGEIDA